MTAEYDADVLVLGGGPAGTWAAIAAARGGARVVLADKGFCGTSGAAAAGGNNLWYVPPGPHRNAAVEARERAAGGITEREWMSRTLAETWDRIEDLTAWGYPFPLDDAGRPIRGSLQGPEYLRRMRRRVHRSGVTILDHHPALELLVTADGTVAGGAGVARQHDGVPWRCRAGAVVLATGGCAFLSKAFGLDVDTGDGHLMAAEVGAELSGMEFSAAYALSPAFGNHTKGLMMQFASYYDEAGERLEFGGLPRVELARRAAAGEQLYARLDQAPPELRELARHAQPNYFLPLDKAGVDPFTTRYPIRFVLEGTVRGTGGLRLADDSCGTGIPGLYAAGDVATREPVSGAISGGGSYNAAWAISTGTWAGTAAARFGSGRRRTGAAALHPAGQAGLRPGRGADRTSPAELVTLVQDQVTPLHRNYFRTAAGLTGSLGVLDDAWHRLAAGLAGSGRDVVRTRQAAAMTAHARWMYRSALARSESRGLHRRDDVPGTDPAYTHRIRTGGLDRVWTRPEFLTGPAGVAA
jgi:succinate dehydrogenase/fumarate reductase flavoprotein subunit